jgi:hypothetical protein
MSGGPFSMIAVRIRTTVHMPEVPDEVELEQGSRLRDLLIRLLQKLPIANEIIDRTTGEIKLEGLFEVLLNDVPRNSLPQGDATELHNGDVVTLSLILLGGG